MTSLYGLSEFDHFNNMTLSHPDHTAQVMKFSPSGEYLLICRDDGQVSFYDANSQTLIPHSIPDKVYSIAFEVSNEDVVYSTGRSIKRYNIKDSTMETLLEQSSDNVIYSVVVSPDYRSLYYTNNNLIKSINLSTKQEEVSQKEASSECIPRYIYVNPMTEDILTSGKNCQICRWRVSSSHQLSLEAKQTSLSVCQINAISCIKREVIIQNSYNMLEEKHIRLDPTSLKKLGATTQTFQNVNKAYLLPVENYMISYAGSDHKVWIYRDFFTEPASIYDFKDNHFIKSIGYNHAKQQIVVSAVEQVTPTEQLGTMTSMQLSFHCPEAIGSTGQETLTECPCSQGHSFNKAQFSCQPQSSNLIDGVMVCPHRQQFNTFNLECELDCNQVAYSASSPPFGSPPQCYCASPHEWNFTSTDCSYIDCSKIPYSASSAPSRACDCQSGYTWSAVRFGCLKNRPVPAQQDTQGTNSEVKTGEEVLGIFLLVFLFGVILFCIIKKCIEKCKEDSPPENRVEHDNREPPPDTDRRLEQQQPPAPPLPDEILTAQHLQAHIEKESPATEAENPDDVLDRFSITDDEEIIDDEKIEEYEPQISEMASNLDQPLQ